MATKFEFVIADPSTNLKPGNSSQLRSHCMRGANKRENSRRSLREKRKQASKARTPPSFDENTPTVPLSLGSFALTRFASRVDAEAEVLLFKAFAYNVANQAMTPLDRCVDFDCIDSVSFQWLFSDAAFLHSILAACYAVNDLMAPTWTGQPGQRVVANLQKTLALLAERLDICDVHEDEAVLYVVVNLAVLAAIYGDWEAAAAHFRGLHRIVQLRGGFKFLKSRPKLHFKLDRYVQPSSLPFHANANVTVSISHGLSAPDADPSFCTQSPPGLLYSRPKARIRKLPSTVPRLPGRPASIPSSSIFSTSLPQSTPMSTATRATRPRVSNPFFLLSSPG